MPGIRLYDLRYAHATLAVRAGADLKTLQRRLGHASLTVSLGLYAHAMPAGDAEAAAGLERVLTGREAAGHDDVLPSSA